MNKLPKSGLIVSCYLTDWAGYEKQFIDIVKENKNIVALRVEGEENIRYAKENTNLPVIGLIKDFKYDNYITPTKKYYLRCVMAGADFVAVDFRDRKKVGWAYSVSSSIWPDIERPEDAIELIKLGFKIISSTFTKDQLSFVGKLFGMDKNIVKNNLNAEGSIDKVMYIDHLSSYCTKYFTIGTAINSPNGIINDIFLEYEHLFGNI